MQLHVARLCLDCNEIHETDRCPVCTSEAFAFLTRWIPATERRQVPRPTTSPAGEVYRDLLEQSQPAKRRLNKGVLSGVGLLAVAGYLWQRRSKGSAEASDTASGDVSSDAPADEQP